MPQTTWNMLQPQRVRLLFQREPDGGSPALEPGLANAASAAGLFGGRQDTLMFNGYEADSGQPLCGAGSGGGL